LRGQRDLEEFARSYEESHEDESDSVFMRVIKESLWQELADITDKTQLEWREVFQDLNHHGVYHSGEVVGLGNLVCEKCHYHLPVYTPDVLPRCPKCGMTSSSVVHLSLNSRPCAERYSPDHLALMLKSIRELISRPSIIRAAGQTRPRVSHIANASADAPAFVF
jgi:hypothetical protein